MSSATSGIITSAAQAASQSREVSASRTAERKSQEVGGQRSGPAIIETGEIVTTTDNDTQVFADAEGLGSQGRESPDDQDDPTKHRSEQPKPGTQEGLHQDPDGHWHVDVEA